ncbi:MAG TPA: O-methyltransferase [Thermoplasmata archaeon]|nr:O-methyltransferase [Thermoplasmata archaeon]
MSEIPWAAVDDYLEGQLLPTDSILSETLAAAVRAGLPEIQVSPLQGRFLYLLAQLVGARRVLEIGTLAGYSAIWLARALPPEGRLISLELDPHHAEVARANLARAGLSERVEVRVGPAERSLAVLAAEGGEPFDLVFLDADKEGYPAYLEWALRLGRPGGLIVADNVVRGGAVVDAGASDPRVRGIRTFLERLGSDPRCTAVVVPMAGRKGYDGFALARIHAR